MKNCKDCNHQISESAEACPNCGAKLKETFVEQVLGLVIVMSILIFLFAVWFWFYGDTFSAFFGFTGL